MYQPPVHLCMYECDENEWNICGNNIKSLKHWGIFRDSCPGVTWSPGRSFNSCLGWKDRPRSQQRSEGWRHLLPLYLSFEFPPLMEGFLELPLTVIDANLFGCRWVIKTCGTADLELDISAETFSPPDEGTLAITIASYTWLHVLFLRLCMVWHRWHRITHDWTLSYRVVSSEGAWGRIACHNFAPHIFHHYQAIFHPTGLRHYSNNPSCLLQRILWWMGCVKSCQWGQ